VVKCIGEMSRYGKIAKPSTKVCRSELVSEFLANLASHCDVLKFKNQYKD